ncbi:MAG TPA: pyrroline-5-carboxylate reductase [bacterium]|jgi:pyrroline-5-carboxylate reductase|nr:pyrroline-5-carboxylate reductase [bacterium]
MPDPQATIAFIGAGNMGEAMLRGLAKAGHSKAGLRAFDLRTDRLKALASEAGFTAMDSVAQAVDGADIVVLAVKPQAFEALLAELAPLLRGGQTLVSVAAGIRLERLSTALASPNLRLVRVMPNTPGLIGQGASAYCLGPSAGPTQAAQTEALLQPLGKVLRVREEDMDAVTALSGSGPAYVFLFMEALQAAGEGLGLSPEASFLLASQTLTGAAAMIQAGEKSPAELRAAVTSPGGTTAAAIRVFEEGGLRGLVDRALAAARDRSKELGR